MKFVGTAGWNVPRAASHDFPAEGTHLQRYAQIFNCVEINSSFYRSHGVATYQRWAGSTSSTFKFSVKMHRQITHFERLRRSRASVQQFLTEVNGLGKKLGAVLIQLPPSLIFEARVASRFFVMLRSLHPGAVVLEPRHASWFEQRAEDLLLEQQISRVAADPSRSHNGGKPGGDLHQLVYYRLHGSPQVYWSNYSEERLIFWANEVRQHHRKVTSWIIFDNTGEGCAIVNALQMQSLLK